MLDDVIYVFSRALSVVVRPLLLYWIVYTGLEDQSIQLALLYTITTSVTYLLAVEVHKEYYRLIFANEGIKFNSIHKVKVFSKYFTDILRMGVLGSLVGFTVWYALSGDLITSLMVLLVIALDYFVVEYMRYLIFAKRFRAWSLVQTSRYTVPAIFVFLVVPFITNEAIFVYLISYVVCLSMAILILIKDARLVRIKKTKYLQLKRISIKTITGLFKDRFFYVAAAFSNRHTILIDRYIIYFIDTTFFTFYTLISLFLNAIPMFVDMFFIARNRARFVKRNIPLLEIFRDKYFIVINIGGILVASASIAFVIITNYTLSSLLVIQSAILLSSFSIFSVSTPIYELIFWHKTMMERLLIEVCYCISLSFIGSVIYFLELPTTWFLIFMMTLHILRFLFLCFTLRFSSNLKS